MRFPFQQKIDCIAPYLEIENPIHVPFVSILGCIEIENQRASLFVAILEYCVVNENQRGPSFVAILGCTEMQNQKVS